MIDKNRAFDCIRQVQHVKVIYIMEYCNVVGSETKSIILSRILLNEKKNSGKDQNRVNFGFVVHTREFASKNAMEIGTI